MRKADAPSKTPARPGRDRNAGRPAEEGEVVGSAAPDGDRATASNETTDNELLCTICGLRACWQ